MSPRNDRVHDVAQGEFALIHHIQHLLGPSGRGVRLGIGDDAAVVTTLRQGCLLLSTDLLVEHVHFDLAVDSLADIGYKATVANLSDIAAMGGIPQVALLALALPSNLFNHRKVKELYRGVRQASRRYGLQIVGGDTSTSPRFLFINMTILGNSATHNYLTRRGAKDGDLLYVTGTLGDARCGLALLHEQRRNRSRSILLGTTHHETHMKFLLQRHRHPTPRLKAGQILATEGLASAAMDLSDGLSGDLRHLCRESGVGADIEEASLPLSRACRQFAESRKMPPSQLALAGGEDYELLFTVAPRQHKKLKTLAPSLGCRITQIGRIRPQGDGIGLIASDGSRHPLPNTSYQHGSLTRKGPGRKHV